MDETIYVILKLLFDFALEVWFSIYYYLQRVRFGDKNNNNYVGKVYNKNIKNITFIIVLPGSTIL